MHVTYPAAFGPLGSGSFLPRHFQYATLRSLLNVILELSRGLRKSEKMGG
jgi:hypothetical protein